MKRTLTFVDDLSVPCLKAALPNSVVPQLAARYIKNRLEDPQFDIFLRSKDPAMITAWQRKMLNRLLIKGELVSAIEQGMKDYKKQRDDNYVEYEKGNWDDAERNGILPHFVLLTVAIDDIRREVILCLATSIDGHLEEHGTAIFLKGRKWEFDSDYVCDYLAEVEEEESNRETPADFEEEDHTPQKPEAAGDPSFLYGAWVFDGEAEAARLKNKGETEREIRPWLLEFEKRRFTISERRFLWWYKYSARRKPDESELIGCNKEGIKVTLKIRELQETKN